MGKMENDEFEKGLKYISGLLEVAVGVIGIDVVLIENNKEMSMKPNQMVCKECDHTVIKHTSALCPSCRLDPTMLRNMRNLKNMCGSPPFKLVVVG